MGSCGRHLTWGAQHMTFLAAWKFCVHQTCMQFYCKPRSGQQSQEAQLHASFFLLGALRKCIEH